MASPSLGITTALLMLCFAALGAGNGATFQLVPLRWPTTTPVAGGMIGEIGALGGGILPNVLGQSKLHTGSYSLGFIAYAGLAIGALLMMRPVGWPPASAHCQVPVHRHGRCAVSILVCGEKG